MRSRTASVVVSALVLVVALAACSKSTSTSGTASNPTAPSPAASSMAPSTAGDMATFTSTSPAYSFQYPSSWTKKVGTSSTLPVVVYSGHTNVNLVLEKVPSGTTLHAYSQAGQQHLAQEGWTVVATHPGGMGIQRALVIESTKVQNGVAAKIAQFLTINGHYAYILTYFAPESEFDANYQTAVAMAESFRFGG